MFLFFLLHKENARLFCIDGTCIFHDTAMLSSGSRYNVLEVKLKLNTLPCHLNTCFSAIADKVM